MQPEQPYQGGGTPQTQPQNPQSSPYFQPSVQPMAMPSQPPASAGQAPHPQGGYPSMMTPASARKGTKLPLILAIVFGVLTLGFAGFGIWAFGGYQDYKNNSDQKATAAAEAAKKAEGERKDAEFVEQEKQPYRTYTSPDATGAIKIVYPKSWSAFIDENEQANPVNGYWHPATVPGLRSGTAYALRMQVTNRPYSDEVKTYDPMVKQGTVKIAPYVPKNVKGVTGSRVTGEITKGQKDTMVILPLRDKTVRIWTESPDFASDFDNIILANLSFTP